MEINIKDAIEDVVLMEQPIYSETTIGVNMIMRDQNNQSVIDIAPQDITYKNNPNVQDNPLSVLTKPAILTTPVSAPFVPIYTVGYSENGTYGYNEAMFLEDLRLYFRKWSSWPKQAEFAASEYLKLAKDEQFSAGFNDVLGAVNITNIAGLDDFHLLAVIFREIVEIEAMRQCNQNRILNDLNKRYCQNCYKNIPSLYENKLHWYVNGQSGGGFVSLLQTVLNVPLFDALATLANIVGMDFSNIHQLSSQNHTAESIGNLNYPEIEVAEFISLPDLPQGSNVAQRLELKHILGNAGQIIGAIALYTLNGRRFCVPATVGNGVLCMGRYKPTAYFLNQDLMDKHPGVPIVFFQDMRSALEMQKKLDQIVSTAIPQVIVTAHVGTDLKVLPWNYFVWHDVVFVCAPTKACMARVKGYKSYIQSAGAKSFKVYRHLLLHSSPNCAAKSFSVDELIKDGFTGAEAELLTTSIFIENIDNPTSIIQKITKDAMLYDDFVKWGQSNGIFKSPKPEQGAAQNNATQTLSFFNPSAVKVSSQPSHLNEVLLSHIISLKGLILIHGAKNVGKSYVVLELIKALVLGKPAFGLFEAGTIMKTVLFDSETQDTIFDSRLRQHELIDSVGTSFFPMLKGDLLTAGHENIVLTDLKFCTEIESIIETKNAKCFIVDNLTTACGSGAVYNPTTMGETLDWAASIGNKLDIATILVHHSYENTNKNPLLATMRGSQEARIRAHTEIIVVGKEAICEGKVPCNDKVKMAAQGNGLTLGLSFRTCKNASILEGKVFWLHLPLNRGNWVFLEVTNTNGNVINFEPKILLHKDDIQPYSAPSQDVSSFELPGRMEGLSLSEDEITIMNHVKTATQIQTKDVVELIGCKDTHARKVLSSLCENQLLEQINPNSSKTAYQLPSQA